MCEDELSCETRGPKNFRDALSALKRIRTKELIDWWIIN